MSTEIPPMRQATETDLSSWFQLKKDLDNMKLRESSLRRFIASSFFPNPAVGTNTTELSTGHMLKLTHALNYKVDDAALTTRKAEMLGLGIPVDKLINWKPDLCKSEYNKLDENQKAIFDQILTITDASPQMSIVEPKKAKSAGPTGS